MEREERIGINGGLPTMKRWMLSLNCKNVQHVKIYLPCNAFEVCNAKTYELYMSTNVYKRFNPRVMEREECIGINGGLPTMKR